MLMLLEAAEARALRYMLIRHCRQISYAAMMLLVFYYLFTPLSR